LAVRAVGLWHPRLLEIITTAGHTDLIVISDAGLPVPADVEIIQLGWREGEPGFLPVLRQVLAEFVVERAVIARELSDVDTLAGIDSVLPGIRRDVVGHEEFKRRTFLARAVVRTGEVTPYANIILQAGVPYGPGPAWDAIPSARQALVLQDDH
jgi:D-ribose pyranase